MEQDGTCLCAALSCTWMSQPRMETVIRLLTNAPAERLGAQQVARLYRHRWSIEGMFGRLESVLHSEVRTLGHPRAALLALGVAVMACNRGARGVLRFRCRRGEGHLRRTTGPELERFEAAPPDRAGAVRRAGLHQCSTGPSDRKRAPPPRGPD
ncbi:transposase [Hyalangium rubrum]|uniref:Transposase n=1 Tax=Hyalangium rubrum TaxID=3103134 RepID=A0ABU5HAU4_9BACT|nr:transposase [Hyalangium sp. s54d21]MDY7229994.1 transposase [Hyalangium sp. s54d21]